MTAARRKIPPMRRYARYFLPAFIAAGVSTWTTSG
jgi:hypothetical protein